MVGSTAINICELSAYNFLKLHAPAAQQKAMMDYAAQELPYVWGLLLSPTTEQRKT